MKKFVTFFIFMLCSTSILRAQSFLDKLRKIKPGEGIVTITQSKEIDELINGKPYPSVKTGNNAPEKNKSEKTFANKKNGNSKNEPRRETISAANNGNKPKQDNEPSRYVPPAYKPDSDDTEETVEPVVNNRKKIMRKSYKVTGYRVQAYAGGNSRADRQKTEQVGNNIKMRFPGEPVYVHFHSPHWICRVGNYRTLQEANKMLKQIKEMGYKQASIVRGKITVQY